MNKFKSKLEIENIETELCALIQRGCAVSIYKNTSSQENPVSVTVMNDGKIYHFSDPDLQVVKSQIITYHNRLKKRGFFKMFGNKFLTKK